MLAYICDIQDNTTDMSSLKKLQSLCYRQCIVVTKCKILRHDKLSLTIVITEYKAAPDVQQAELLTNNKLSLVSSLYDEADREQREDGDLPLLATMAIIVLASLVTLLLIVLGVILYYKYQKRKIKQPLKAINRLNV